MKRILFIHRSVGNNLLKDGHLAELLQAEASKAGIVINFQDINNNKQKGVPGDDTKPVDYLEYFKNNKRDEDLVIIKSCYPNNAIDSDVTLNKLKETYQEIADAFIKRSAGRLLILTTPPLRPSRTTTAQAKCARSLATWLVTLKHNRVSVFDFYDLLAESASGKEANTLKQRFRRWAPWDNHPNKIASVEISQKLAPYVINMLT